MSERRYIPPPIEGRSVQIPGNMRRGPYPGFGTPLGQHSQELISSERANAKISVQAEEIERLAGENHRLAASQVTLRQDLVAAQQEVQRVKAHIRSIRTESDIQIRVLFDKIAKMEGEIRGGEIVKNDLQRAHAEAQNLATLRQELIARVQTASQELKKTHLDVQKLPEMHAELDNLRQEHQKLRATFEYEKGLNIEQVEQMQAMERNLVGMAGDIEKLRGDVLNAESRARAPPNPYRGAYVGADHVHPSPVQVSAPAFVDAYGRPHVNVGVGTVTEGIFPYGGGQAAAPSGGVSGGGAVWGGGGYDPSFFAHR